MKFFIYTLVVLSIIIPNCASAQSIATEFGKNRVQFHNDHYDWSRYETENFMTYWYGKSRNIAQPAIQLAELDHSEIQKILEHTLSDRIELIVYIDVSDLKQSNIGAEEAFTSEDGKTVVNGNKILVYFDGDHQNLRKQIKQGIAHVYLNSILYGSNIQEIVQNALLLNLPSWFGDGLIAYSESTWNYESDDELRDLLSSDNYDSFNKLSKEHSRIAGHSFWHFVSNKYGASTIANIVYLTRISRNLENSFNFILDIDYKNLEEDWFDYYSMRYEAESDKFTNTEALTALKLKNKKGVPVSNYRISPNGKLLAYVTNDRSKTRVYVKDLETGKEKLLLKNGHKNIFQESDYSYPLIAWHPSFSELSIIYEKRDVIKLRVINLKTNNFEEEDMTTNFQRIYSMDYIAPEHYLFSASTDGYSDLYTYKSENRHHKRITEDFFDDLEASVATINNKRGVLFRSNRDNLSLEKNRLDTILPVNNFDLYFLDGFDKKASLTKLTETPQENEKQAYQSSSSSISYLSERSGIQNLYELDLVTGTSSAKTNLERNIILHHTVTNIDFNIFNYYYKGNYNNFTSSRNSTAQPFFTVHATSISKALKQNDDLAKLEEEKVDLPITEGIKFQTKFSDEENIKPIEEVDNEIYSSVFDKYFKDYFSESYLNGRRIVKYNPMRASASRTRFRLDDFMTRLDNEVLFEGLQSFSGENNELNNVPAGILFRGDIKDLLEDYEISVGLRIPTRFNGYEYFATIDDNKKLWDKRIAFYRRKVSNVVDPNSFPIVRERRNTFIGLYRLKYPFDVYQSVRFTGSLRFDNFFNQSTSLATFEAPQDFEKRLSLKAEYVFDNTFDISLNIKNGTRAKVYSEIINEFDLQLRDSFQLDASRAITGIIGFDARHYIPVFKKVYRR